MKRIIDPPREALHRLRPPLRDGEWRVLEFFDRFLPPAWEIYVQPHLNGLRPDFVLLNPNVGIALFEVKDWDLRSGAYEYRPDPETGRPTFRVRDAAGHEGGDNRDPLQTIRNYYYETYELYCPRLDRKARKALITAGLIFSAATRQEVEHVFSSAIRGHHEMQQYPDTWPIVGRGELQRGNLNAVFPKATDRTSSFMSDALAEDLRNWLREPRVSAEQRVPFSLDQRQRELVTTRTTTGYRRVKGPAGCGKSLVLAARAAELSADGKDVLVVSFNITLLNYLRDRAVQWRQMSRRECEQITWLNFHYWCKRVCRQLGRESDYRALWVDADDEEGARARVLDERLPRFVGDLLSVAHHRGAVDTYDAILVDEGQDFRLSWWDALRKALRPKGEMLLVADRTQDLYGTAHAWTDGDMPGSGFVGRWNELMGSYRLPPDLIPHARRFAEAFLPAIGRELPQVVQGELGLWPCSLEWISVPQVELIDRCTREVMRASNRHEGSGSNADVVFLASSNGLGRRVVENLNAVNWDVRHTFDTDQEKARRQKFTFFMGHPGIKGTTIHSFKGWESRTIVIGISPNDSEFGHAATYAALTRLKRDERGSVLVVVCTDPLLEAYGATWTRPNS